MFPFILGTFIFSKGKILSAKLPSPLPIKTKVPTRAMIANAPAPMINAPIPEVTIVPKTPIKVARPNILPRTLSILTLPNASIPSNAPILSPSANAPKIPVNPTPNARPPIANAAANFKAPFANIPIPVAAAANPAPAGPPTAAATPKNIDAALNEPPPCASSPPPSSTGWSSPPKTVCPDIAALFCVLNCCS